MRIRGLLVALALPLVLATGCGEETSTATDPAPSPSASDDSLTAEPASPSSPASPTSPSSPSSPADGSTSAPSAPESPPGSPQCDDVWMAGATLPGGYGGCFEGSDKVKPESRYCAFGKKLHTHRDRFYAVPGGTIAEAGKPFARDAGYRDVLAKCSG